MQLIVAAVLQGIIYLFKSRLGLFIVSALVWLGINFATLNIVMGPTLDLLRDYAGNMNQSGSGLAGAASAWIGVLQFDKALTMLISAYVTRQAIMQGRLYLWKRGALQ